MSPRALHYVKASKMGRNQQKAWEGAKRQEENQAGVVSQKTLEEGDTRRRE